MRNDGDVVMPYANIHGSSSTSHDDHAAPRPKANYEYPSSTNRLEDSYNPPSRYPPSPPPSGAPHDHGYLSTKQLIPTDSSFYSSESETASAPHTANPSTTSLLSAQDLASRREADSGIRLAGGPVRESWFVNGGTLPPAYGEFR